jgi:hypothetical protein
LNDDRQELTKRLKALRESFGDEWFVSSRAVDGGLAGDMTARGFGQVLSSDMGVISGGLVLRKRFDEASKTGQYKDEVAFP